MADTDNAKARLAELRARWDSDRRSRVFLQLAEELRRQGQPLEAMAVLDEGLSRHPTSVAGQVLLGRCRLESGQLEAAAATLEDVVRRDPTHLVAYRWLTETYLQLGDAERSRDRLDLYAQLNPQGEDLSDLSRRLVSLETASSRSPAALPIAERGPAAATPPEAAAAQEPTAAGLESPSTADAPTQPGVPLPDTLPDTEQPTVVLGRDRLPGAEPSALEPQQSGAGAGPDAAAAATGDFEAPPPGPREDRAETLAAPEHDEPGAGAEAEAGSAAAEAETQVVPLSELATALHPIDLEPIGEPPEETASEPAEHEDEREREPEAAAAEPLDSEAPTQHLRLDELPGLESRRRSAELEADEIDGDSLPSPFDTQETEVTPPGETEVVSEGVEAAAEGTADLEPEGEQGGGSSPSAERDREDSLARAIAAASLSDEEPEEGSPRPGEPDAELATAVTAELPVPAAADRNGFSPAGPQATTASSAPAAPGLSQEPEASIVFALDAGDLFGHIDLSSVPTRPLALPFWLTGAQRVVRPVQPTAERATPTLAALYLDQGHADDAARIYGDVLAREPENPAARAGLEQAAGPRRELTASVLLGGYRPDRGGLSAKQIFVLQRYLAHLRGKPEPPDVS